MRIYIFKIISHLPICKQILFIGGLMSRLMLAVFLLLSCGCQLFKPHQNQDHNQSSQGESCQDKKIYLDKVDIKESYESPCWFEVTGSSIIDAIKEEENACKCNGDALLVDSHNTAHDSGDGLINLYKVHVVVKAIKFKSSARASD